TSSAIIAIGQTGTGKTYSLIGRPLDEGLIYRLITELLKHDDLRIGFSCWKIDINGTIFDVIGSNYVTDSFEHVFASIEISNSEDISQFVSVESFLHTRSHLFLRILVEEKFTNVKSY